MLKVQLDRISDLFICDSRISELDWSVNNPNPVENRIDLIRKTKMNFGMHFGCSDMNRSVYRPTLNPSQPIDGLGTEQL